MPQSYKFLLEKWCKKIKPKRVLEWGPGHSSLLLRELCPDAEIISIEHLEWYYNEWKERLKEANIKVLFFKGEVEKPPPEYWNPPLTGIFDLIFVDGRERVKCLNTAKSLILDVGVVILHDSTRDKYLPGIRLFKKIEEHEATVCLQK